MKKLQPKGGGGKKVLAVGIGLAALGAAAYALLGPNGKKNQKKLRGWALTMYGEIMDRVEHAKELTEPAFNKIVAEVSKKYAAMKDVDQKDIEAAIAKVHKEWKKISKKFTA